MAVDALSPFKPLLPAPTKLLAAAGIKLGIPLLCLGVSKPIPLSIRDGKTSPPVSDGNDPVGRCVSLFSCVGVIENNGDEVVVVSCTGRIVLDGDDTVITGAKDCARVCAVDCVT